MHLPPEPASPAAKARSGDPLLAWWRTLLLISLVLISALAWMPGQQVPIGTPWDKLNHLLAFASLGFLAWRAYPTRRAAAFGVLLAFGVLIELVQGQLPTRSAEPLDLAADAIGLAVGAVGGRLFSRLA